MEPGKLATMSLRQHRGQNQLGRDSGWWWGRDAGNHIVGDAVSHLVSQRRVELHCPGKELAGDLSLSGGQSG